MENLKIQPTFNTPTIDFNAETGKLFLKGRSIPEDPGEFYERIFYWLEEYFSKSPKETELEFQIEYANSGSTKYLLEILKEIYRLSSEGKNVRVIWCFEEDDESIEELGELFRNSVNLSFEMKVIYEEDEDEGQA